MKIIKIVYLQENQNFKKMNNFRSREHNIYTEKVNKVALNCEDDKRFICEDGIHTFAPGH